MQEIFDAGTLARGRVYAQQRRVERCEISGLEGVLSISASVQGNDDVPYEVAIGVSVEDEVVAIDGSCSCPMEVNCKHVVATLFHILDHPKLCLPQSADLQQSPLPSLAKNSKPSVNPQLQSWLRRITETPKTEPTADSQTPETSERLVYLLSLENNRLKLDLGIVRPLKKGGYGQPQSIYVSSVVYQSPPAYMKADDVQLIRRAMLIQARFNSYEIYLEGEAGADLLREFLETGRCQWRRNNRGPSLKLGAPRSARPVWKVGERGFQSASFQIEPPISKILPLTPLWYYDQTTSECGPLEIPLPPRAAAEWLNAPPISPEEAVLVASEFDQEHRELPAPVAVEIQNVKKVRPVPCLRLFSVQLKEMYFRWNPSGERERMTSLAALEFDYGGNRVKSDSTGPLIENFSDGKLMRIPRSPSVEQAARRLLEKAGLLPATNVLFDVTLGTHAKDLAFAESEDWLDFVIENLPELRQRGWKIEIEDSFEFRVAEAESWYADAESEKQNDWFGVELGVVVEGEKINLLPILLQLLKASPRMLNSETLEKLSDEDRLPVPLPDGRKLMFPVQRARQMLGALLELMNPNALNSKGKLRLPKLRALELAEDAEWRWLGSTELKEMSARLKNFSGIQPVAVSARLGATLRPYQQEGLNWLQFLREYELAGVLADDMGLGKTVQTLAHLLAEKESGRMDRPSIVIAPTSLMTNWRQECERFAPDLRVLVLHGTDRKQHFERISDHDLIITSYPLLPRDSAVLLKEEFHYVILDEAQFIKNPKTQFAQIACALKARHRLCLTGTPMENHLGELWSLFHFLLPGFLGDELRFNSLFRRPIEKGQSEDRRKLLARRVAPFILRRKKEAVVQELPPKTEIVQNVELTGAQRDLYESVRLAMHERVRQEVDSKGFSRAHIIILDALLKLRQICCHPQLLSLPSAQKVKESAKLDLLLDLLPEMISEGRRILLFSQFTSMLDLIEKEIDALKIPFVRLTGETRDRATPVAAFQAGKVPLFLISLKAGGTGLNLTAADTVIHYDPWWNPAVENQATDRAHRIGQTKNVFVYKLMTVGTVEEKISAMQARKRELVEGLLSEKSAENLKLTSDDLDVLFSPLS